MRINARRLTWGSAVWERHTSPEPSRTISARERSDLKSTSTSLPVSDDITGPRTGSAAGPEPNSEAELGDQVSWFWTFLQQLNQQPSQFGGSEALSSYLADSSASVIIFVKEKVR